MNRTKSRILGALSKLDESLLNPQIRTHSGTVPGTFRNTNVKNQEPNEDRSQDDSHPEVGPSVCQTRHSIDSDLDKAPHKLTGVQEEIRYLPHMVTVVQEENRYRPHSVTSFQEAIPYCSPGIFSEKQKKASSTSQPQFRSENTPATNEADQFLLALQQLATKSNSANINNNINRKSNLPKSLILTMSTIDGY